MSTTNSPHNLLEKKSIMETQDTIMMENSVLIPIVIQYIEQNHKATLPLKGYSMRPYLENQRDKALLIKAENIKKGDVVLAEIRKGIYVLHRVKNINGSIVTLLGDGNLTTENCNITDVKAKAIGFYRKGRNKLNSVEGIEWKLYSFIWEKLFPIRRWILAIHRRLPGIKKYNNL